MNAYELADDVKNISNTIEALEWVQKASPLLRQQAQAIATLSDRIAELSKNVDELEEELLKTPQIKELSDEEIEQIAVKWYVGTRILPIGFARAILKKASEK